MPYASKRVKLFKKRVKFEDVDSVDDLEDLDQEDKLEDPQG